MKIGIDFRPALLGHAGIGRYARELCRALPASLAPEESLLLYGVAWQRPARNPRSILKDETRGAVRLVQKRFPSRLLHLLGRFGLLHVENFTGPMDLFVFTDFVYPPLKRTPHVLMLFDLLFLYEPGINTPAFCRDMEKRVRRALRGAAGVMVSSRAVLQDLERFFPDLDVPRKVIPLGGDHLAARNAPASDNAMPSASNFMTECCAPASDSPLPPAPYFLTVGTLEPRKNHVRLLEAFERIAPAFPQTRWVIAGRPGWMAEPFHQRLDASPVRGRVELRLDADDRELRALYKHALALVYPSLGEGFGLPVAEALALGCPVITSNRSSLPEVAGGAALLIDPLDAGSIAAAMKRLAEEEDASQRLRALGLERAKQLTWASTADLTLEFLREIAASANPAG